MGAITNLAKPFSKSLSFKLIILPKSYFTLALLVIFTAFWSLDAIPLFDWDEINFAETGREMLVNGNFLQPTVNYVPFHEKPPLFTWLQVLSFKTWGVGSLGARFPNLVCGLLSILLLWRLAPKKHPSLGYLWAAFMGLSILPLLYFRSGIIDPWFNLFILAGLWPALRNTDKWWEYLLGGLILGLAVLTKGPAAGLIAGLCWLALLWVRPQARLRRATQYLVTGLLALVPISIWLYFLWQQDDGFFAREFLTYQWRLFIKEDAGHGGFFGYHAVVLLLGCFPASMFALPALFRRSVFNTDVDKGMRILFWVVLILFSIVNTKIVHYSSLAYFPLAWFAARGLLHGYSTQDWSRIRSGSLIIWSIYGLVSLAVPVLAWQLPQLLPAIKDAALTARLVLPVEWPWYTLLPGLIIIGGITVLTLAKKKKALRQAGVQLALSALFVTSALAVFAPRIQAYSQGELVSFFESHAGEDAYFGTAYHKSYAHWFYGQVSPSVYRSGCQERQCRFHEVITKPLFFSSPMRKTEQVLREVPDAKLLYQSGGYSFYERPPTSPIN